jgi:hypothetical protein
MVSVRFVWFLCGLYDFCAVCMISVRFVWFLCNLCDFQNLTVFGQVSSDYQMFIVYDRRDDPAIVIAVKSTSEDPFPIGEDWLCRVLARNPRSHSGVSRENRKYEEPDSMPIAAASLLAPHVYKEDLSSDALEKFPFMQWYDTVQDQMSYVDTGRLVFDPKMRMDYKHHMPVISLQLLCALYTDANCSTLVVTRPNVDNKVYGMLVQNVKKDTKFCKQQRANSILVRNQSKRHKNYTKAETIQTTQKPHKLHRTHTSRTETIQTTQKPHKPHRNHTNRTETTQTAQKPYKPHRNHTNCTETTQTTQKPHKPHRNHTKTILSRCSATPQKFSPCRFFLELHPGLSGMVQ